MSDYIQLGQLDTRRPEDLDKQALKEATKEMAKEVARLQEMFYANGDRAMLVVFQGMDTSGKDGSTREIFKYSSPNGVRSFSFKKPTTLEFAHDFLWRVHRRAPEKGQIHVFNRSHYEDILIQYVHGWIDDQRREMRMDAINAFERLLSEDNDTTIIKIYLHLSSARQKEKLDERQVEEDKFWKFNPADLEERKHWDQYREAYEYVINNSHIPWHIVPADSRTYRNYLATKIVLDHLRAMKMTWPPLNME